MFQSPTVLVVLSSDFLAVRMGWQMIWCWIPRIEDASHSEGQLLDGCAGGSHSGDRARVGFVHKEWRTLISEGVGDSMVQRPG